VGVDIGIPLHHQHDPVPPRFTGNLNKLTVKLGPKQVSAEDTAKIQKTMRDRQ